MSQLKKEFSVLGFDLLGLDNLIYATEPEEPAECSGGSCDGGCTNGCYRCKPGSKND
jgi:hypothetical protein